MGEEEEEFLSLEEKEAKAKEVTASRFLTDEDFRKIDAAQLKKQVTGVKKKKGKKQKREELVQLDNIELIHGKKKTDKAARMEAIMKGREGREKFGRGKRKLNEHASTTNKVKAKKKNFSMMKHKIKKKVKKSFREKQQELQKRLKKQEKFSR